MRKVLLGFGIFISLIYIIPLLTVSLFVENKEEQRVETDKGKSGHLVLVYNKETDKIEEYDIEEYLVGVVTAEMPASYEVEALKAQAVAARSYILSREGGGIEAHKGADVCTDPSHCKAYLSEKEANEKWGEDWSGKYLEKIKSAVALTKGEYMTYEGEVVVACFSAVTGGKTENASDVWGGETPYLKSVDSSVDLSYDGLTTEKAVPIDEFCKTLEVSSANIGDITKSEGGSVKTINIGGKEFSGGEIRGYFKLNSANFDIKLEGENVIIASKGKGHGVGMSQYGANEMAKNGINYTEILLHYYSNVTIEKMQEI